MLTAVAVYVNPQVEVEPPEVARVHAENVPIPAGVTESATVPCGGVAAPPLLAESCTVTVQEMEPFTGMLCEPGLHPPIVVVVSRGVTVMVKVPVLAA